MDRNELIEQNLYVADLVARRCLRSVPPTVEYDDLRSVALLSIAKHATKYDSARASAKTYFYECAYRDVLNFLQKEFLRKRRMVQFPEDLDEAPALVPTEIHPDLEGMVERLPFLQSVALSLRYLDGLSEAEAAERMGIAVRRFQGLECRAIARIRKNIS